MDKIVKKFSLILCLFFMLGQSVHGFVGSSDLVMVPSAVMERSGYIEFGTVYNVNQKIDGYHTDPVSFYRIAFLDRFEYCLSVLPDFTLLHSLQTNVLSYKQEELNLEHHVASGVKNLGWNSSIDMPYSPVYDAFTVYTLSLLKHHTNIHLGWSSDKARDRVSIGFFGLEMMFGFGKVMVEMDGNNLNAGFKYDQDKFYNFYFSVTPQSTSQVGGVDPRFRVGLSFTGNFLDQWREQFAEREKFEAHVKYVTTRLDVLTARDKANAEIMSLSFLEELEKAYIQNNLIQKELKEETKSVIKAASGKMQKGLEYFYKGNYKKSLEEYRSVVSLLPTFPIGYVRLGSLYYKLGQTSFAIANWRRALELDPKNTKLKKYLNQLILRELGEGEEKKPVMPKMKDITL